MNKSPEQVCDREVVVFRFKLNQDVKIRPLDLPGRILARCDRGLWHEYRIIYWNESKRYDEWLCEYELTEVNNK
jgi:hypothetical protein